MIVYTVPASRRGLKRSLDSGTPVTGTKGRLGTEDLDRDW